MNLYASREDYLEAILVLYKKFGSVRSVDIARHMGVSKPSVCHAVNVLCDGGFLKEQLISAGVRPNIAETEACRIEHCISDESFLKLKEHREKGKG